MTSSLLTPAGTVVEAYKQQEQMRSSHASKGSGSGSGGDDTPKIPTIPISDIMQGDASASPLPYYAVLGGTSRLMAVGGPEEHHTGGRHWHSKQEPGRSLMRKVVSTRRQKAIKGDRTTSAFYGLDLC